MNTDLTNAAIATDDKRNAQCDSAAKHILSNKFLLAHILASTTENSDISEGIIYFDIVFYVRMLDGISQIIINLSSEKQSEKILYPKQSHIL